MEIWFCGVKDLCFCRQAGPWISPQTETVFLLVRRYQGTGDAPALSCLCHRQGGLSGCRQRMRIETPGGRGAEVDGGQRTGQVLHHRLDSPPPLGCPVWGPGQLSCRDQAAAASPATTAAPAAGTPVSRQNCGSPSPPLASCLVQAAKNNPLGSMHQHQGSSSAGSTTGGWLVGKKALPVGGKLT